MKHANIWLTLQRDLQKGLRIRNWTVLKGYLGDEFAVESVGNSGITIETPNAQAVLFVPRKDFEYMNDIWEAYCASNVPRQTIAQNSRFSKYTISILKHVLGRRISEDA